MGGRRRGAHSAVDWDLVDAEVSNVAEELSDPAFDPLPHVIDILSQIEPEVKLRELRHQQEKIESFVDDVVRAYHNGFNKALQNYSGILQHFSAAQDQSDTLRRALDDSRKRLGAQSRHLQAQWRKSITLSDTLRLMGDIQSIVELPEQIQQLEQDKEWAEAVALLIEGSNKLARDEMQKIEGLSNLRKEMGERRQALQDQIIEELQTGVYAECHEEDRLVEEEEDSFLEEETARPGPLTRRMSGTDLLGSQSSLAPKGQGRSLARQSSLSKPEAAGKPAGRRLTGDKMGLLRHTSDLDMLGGSQRPGSLRRRNSTMTGESDSAPLGLQSRRVSRDMASGLTDRSALGRSRRNTKSTMDLLSDRGINFNTGQDTRARGFESLVQCLVQIGSVGEAKSVLCSTIPQRLRELIRRVLENTTKPALEEALNSLNLSDRSQQASRTSVQPAVEAAVRSLLQRILDSCLRALRNLTHLLSMISKEGQKDDNFVVKYLKEQVQGTSEPPESALQVQGSGNSGTSGAGSNPNSNRSLFSLAIMSGEEHQDRPAVLVDAEQMWNLIMRECEFLLKDLLSPSSGEGATQGDAGNSLASISAEGVGRLTFTFDIVLEGFDPDALITRRGKDVATSDAEAAPSYKGDVKRALGHEPSPYFTAALYRPVVQFVDSGNRVLDGLAHELRSSRSQGKSDSAKLRAFLESVVVDSFLPRVRVDFRARCNAILEDPEMFRTRARFRAAYEKEVTKGRPVLGVALAVEQLMGEVMGWAVNMPLFSQQLTGVVEGFLGRMLEACSSLYAATTTNKSASAKLASRPDVASRMASEPAGALLQEPVKFYVPKKEDEFDARPAIAAISSTGLGTGGDSIAQELLQMILKEHPVAEAALLMDETGDMSRLTQLAALSDSLDYLAEVVQRYSSAGATSTRSKAFKGHNRQNSFSVPSLSEGLRLMVERCRALSGRCLRSLRLELQLTLLYYLQELPRSCGLNDQGESIEAEERLGALTRTASRLEDALLPFLPSRHRAYVLGSGAATAARLLRSLAPEIQEITPMGVEHICKACSVLQPVLAALGGSAEASATQSQQSTGSDFEATRTYFGLLNMPVDSLLKFAKERPTRYSPGEYVALLEVHVPGRAVTDEHRVQLAKALGREKGRKATAVRDAIKRERKTSENGSPVSMMERLTRERLERESK